jgi:hypothetical protein
MPATTRRPYQFPGEKHAFKLAKWLNGPGTQTWEQWADELATSGIWLAVDNPPNAMEADNRSRGRVVGLLEDLQESSRLFHKMWTAVERKGSPSRDDQAKFQALGRQVDRRIQRYKFRRRIDFNFPHHWGKEWSFVNTEQIEPFSWEFTSITESQTGQELAAIRELEQLCKHDWLERFRRCERCGIWFYARKHFARFHSDECRQRKYQTSDQYRERRQQYRMNKRK